jgi:DNA-binding transcriptional ArsR family regulator
MNKTKVNLLLHPVRLRIILVAARRQVTAGQLASELPDIAQATLYRNINTLAAAGILSVVRERRVHNTLEKTYALPEQGLLLTVEDLKNAGPDDYILLFTHFLGLLLGYYVRYVQKGNVDFPRDGVNFQMFPAYLSEAEMHSLAQAINTAMLPFVKNEPSPERQRFIFGLLSLPDVGGRSLPADSRAGAPRV